MEVRGRVSVMFPAHRLSCQRRYLTGRPKGSLLSPIIYLLGRYRCYRFKRQLRECKEWCLSWPPAQLPRHNKLVNTFIVRFRSPDESAANKNLALKTVFILVSISCERPRVVNCYITALLQKLSNHGLTHIRASREIFLSWDFFLHLFYVFRQSSFIVLQYFFSFSCSGWSVVVNASRADGTARSHAYKPKHRYC